MTRVKILLGSAATVVAVAAGAWAGQAAAAVPASAAAPASAPAAFAEGAPTGVLAVCTPSWGSLVLPICV